MCVTRTVSAVGLKDSHLLHQRVHIGAQVVVLWKVALDALVDCLGYIVVKEAQVLLGVQRDLSHPQ